MPAYRYLYNNPARHLRFIQHSLYTVRCLQPRQIHQRYENVRPAVQPQSVQTKYAVVQAISFPEPTCLLVSSKTRSSGIINKLVPRALVSFAFKILIDTAVLSKPNFGFPSFPSAYWMPLWNVSTSTLGTLRYEDGKARTGTAVNAGNFRGHLSLKTKCLRCVFSQRTATSRIRTSKTLFSKAMTSFRPYKRDVICKRRKHLKIFYKSRQNFPMKKSNKQSGRPALDAFLPGTTAFENLVAGESWLLENT